MAQNVYSLNVVGYINIPLVEGFNLIANQLDFDGTGTNNGTANILGTNLPQNSVVYTWSGGNFEIASFVKLKGQTAPAWTANYSLNPGQGAWLSIPAGAFGGATQLLTTVGTVDTGALVNPNMASAGGFSLLGSMVPIAGGLQSVLNYTPMLNDSVYQYINGGYVISTYAKLKGANTPTWNPNGEPQIAIGQGFWLNSSAGSVWSNYFIVQ